MSLESERISEVKIISIGEDSKEVQRAKCKGMQITDFFQKPVKVRAVIQAIESHIYINSRFLTT